MYIYKWDKSSERKNASRYRFGTRLSLSIVHAPFFFTFTGLRCAALCLTPVAPSFHDRFRIFQLIIAFEVVKSCAVQP